MRALLLLLVVGAAFAQDPYAETRYCGVFRDADGTISRSSSVLTAFRRLQPCPSTGLYSGACPGWAVNHVIPLACGGCDSVSNMQWMRNDVKRVHDSYEREITAPSLDAGDSCQLEKQL